MTTPTEAVSPVVSAGRGDVREVGQLAYPVVLSQISGTVMGIVDSAMVGRLGATELGAVGFAGIWTWTLFSFFNGTASGVQTFVSQHHGAGEERRCGAWAWQAIATIAPLAVCAAALVWLSAPQLLAWLGPSQELQETALAYVRPRLLGQPAMVLVFIWMSFFRGIGDTRTPLYGAVIANLVNIVLDYGLIFGELGLPKWGVVGAGSATAVGEWIYAIFLIVAATRTAVSSIFHTRPVAPRHKDVRRFLRTGLPIGGQWLIDMLAFSTFTTIVARMGDHDVAASQAFVMLLSMSFMQAIGISVAASTLVGRYIGARDPEAVTRSFWSSLKFAGALAGIVAAVFLAFPEAMVRIFSSDPEVVRRGVPLVRLGALFQLLDAVAIVTSGSLRGAGDTRWPFLVQALLAWGLFVPGAYLLGVVWNGGLTSAWVAGTFYIAVLAGVLLARFHGGAWRSIRV